MGSVAPRERPPLFLMGVFVLLLLALDRPLPVPEAARTWAALAAVLLVPGAGLALLWPGFGRHGWLAPLALAFPLSLLPVTGAALVGRWIGWPPLAVAAGYLFGVFLVVLAALVLSRWRGVDRQPGRRFSVAGALLLVIAVALCGRAGAPTGPGTDGPDHVTTVNEILTTGQFFPRQGLVPAGELNRSDPRKGVFHVGLALAAALAGVPARTVWTSVPAVLVLSWLPLVILMGLRLGAGRAGALLAAALALLVMGGEGGPWAVRLGYGAHAGLLVAWAATWVLLSGARETRVADRVLVAVLAAVAGAVHPLAPAFLFLPALVMAVPWGRGALVPRSRWLGTLLAAALAAAPVLALRLREAAGPVNPLHEQVMPVLRWGGWGSVLWPPTGWSLLGWVGLAGVALAPFSRRFIGERIGRGYLGAAMLVSLGAVWVPGVFDLGARLASSLPVKLLYMTPYFWLIGAFLASPWRGRGILPRALVASVVLLALPGAVARFAPDRVAGWRPAGIDAMLAELRRLPGPGVVAADPWVSSLVAAETPHRPITVVHQHGHPLDPRGLERLQDVGEILSPWLAPDAALPVLTRYDAGYLLVSDPETAPGPFAGEPPLAVLGAARGGALERLRAAKFAGWPESYPIVRRTPGWTLITPRRGSRSPSPPPLCRAGWGPPRGVLVRDADGEAGGTRLLALEVPAVGGGGETIPVVCWWWREPGELLWPVEAHLRLARIGGREGAKPLRLIREGLLHRGGPRGRHREVLIPFLGAWPASSWPEGVALADTVRIGLPEGLAPGAYEVSVKVRRQSMFFEAGLRDLWRDDDRWEGAVLDTLALAGGPR